MAEKRLIVAAIDFGTTFSGYAFSFAHDYQSIQTNHWIGGGHISLKAPTTVLFNPQKKIHSFGYAAEDKYGELAEEDDHKEWYYFRRFKMMLHENKVLSRDTLISDEHNKQLPAIKVFSSAIKYLKEHLLDAVKKRVTELHDEDVHWVLTVPAIWNESAKQFMREAAVEADINSDNLTLALEPEAASIFCKQLPVDRFNGATAADFQAFKSGTTYMVLDLGGGTVDITVHSVESDGSLSEVAKASGGAWGGTQVDDAFLQFLQDIVSEIVFNDFRENNTADFLDLMREFEARKRNVSSATDTNVVVKLPASLCETFKRKKKKCIADHIKSTCYAETVFFKRDKMLVDSEIVKGFFTKSISRTIEHIKSILAEHEFQEIDTVLMVGGFAESEIVRERIRNAFSNKRVINPSESGLVVLKGAVMFGHNPTVMKSRVSKYTYGTEVISAFVEGKQPEEYKFFDHFVGYDKCRYVFEPFVMAGEVVQVDKVVAKRYRSDIVDVTEGVGIYASTSESPKYVVDKDCFKLGSMFLDEPGHEVIVEMQFGGTEFSVQITDLDTGKKLINCFDFLSH